LVSGDDENIMLWKDEEDEEDEEEEDEEGR